MAPWEEYAASAAPQAALAPWEESAAVKTGPAMSRTDKFLTGAADPIHGGAQLLTNMLPKGMVDAGNSVNNWLADKTGLVARLPEGGVDQQVREREAAYEQQRKAAGESGFDGYRVLGNLFSPANVATNAIMPKVASLLARMVVGSGFGAVGGALTPVTEEGSFAEQKAMQAGSGALFGGATPAAIGGLSRVISPHASVNPNVQLLKNEGVTPTIGQALGGRWNALEEKATSLPIAGDMISGARARALGEFNEAAINRAVAPVGGKVSGTGQSAVMEAGDVVGGAYDRAKQALGAFKIDRQATGELANLRMMARSGLEGRERTTFEGYFKDYLRRPALTADSFKELDSKLAKDIGNFTGSNDAYQQKVGEALMEVRRIITDNAKRANPQAAALLKDADKAYANLVRVEGASKAGMNSGGVFTPGQLNLAVRQADKSVRDRATSRGTALMQDLSGAGQQVLGNKVPNSFTTDRALIAGGGLGAYFIDPMIPMGLLGAGAMYTKPMQSLLSGAVTSRPQSAQAMAEALRKASPGFGLLGGQVGAGLLEN